MRECKRCGKSFIMGGTRKLLRGHYNPTSWKKKRANLQWTRLLVANKRSRVCAKCIRALTKGKSKK